MRSPPAPPWPRRSRTGSPAAAPLGRSTASLASAPPAPRSAVAHRKQWLSRRGAGGGARGGGRGVGGHVAVEVVGHVRLRVDVHLPRVLRAHAPGQRFCKARQRKAAAAAAVGGEGGGEGGPAQLRACVTVRMRGGGGGGGGRGELQCTGGCGCCIAAGGDAACSYCCCCGCSYPSCCCCGTRVGIPWISFQTCVAPGGCVIKCPSSLNVLKDTYDHGCY
jgi:hypothetical protein